VDTRAGLDDVEKRQFLILPGLELRTISRPARSQSHDVVLFAESENIVKWLGLQSHFGIVVYVCQHGCRSSRSTATTQAPPDIKLANTIKATNYVANK
jgi:hypothetical protein